MRQRQILLLIETSWSYGCGLLRGIASYARLRGSWVVTHYKCGLEAGLPPWVRQWRGDGIIARIETKAIANFVAARNLPTVDVTGDHPVRGTVICMTDPAATANMALDHFIERGYDHLAYCGYPGVFFSDARRKAFVHAADQRGRQAHVYGPRRGQQGITERSLTESVQDGEHDPRLVRWLRKLPRPVGVMACNDIRGRQVLRACLAAELSVPEQVAVIGVDNDDVDCELANPPLSSIEPATQTIGFRSAEILDRLMDGEKPAEELVRIPPTFVDVRRSTDMIVTDDREFGAALRFIQDHACDGINVEDVLRHVGLSRSTLERRCKRRLGHSPKEQIMRVRLVHVKRLLLETNLPLPAIAHHTGFKTGGHMSAVFRQHFGHTPTQYRGQS